MHRYVSSGHNGASRICYDTRQRGSGLGKCTDSIGSEQSYDENLGQFHNDLLYVRIGLWKAGLLENFVRGRYEKMYSNIRQRILQSRAFFINHLFLIVSNRPGTQTFRPIKMPHRRLTLLSKRNMEFLIIHRYDLPWQIFRFWRPSLSTSALSGRPFRLSLDQEIGALNAVEVFPGPPISASVHSFSIRPSQVLTPCLLLGALPNAADAQQTSSPSRNVRDYQVAGSLITSALSDRQIATTLGSCTFVTVAKPNQ
jgi:hypothetical protein